MNWQPVRKFDFCLMIWCIVWFVYNIAMTFKYMGTGQDGKLAVFATGIFIQLLIGIWAGYRSRFFTEEVWDDDDDDENYIEKKNAP